MVLLLHAANPLDWFEDWLAQPQASRSPSQPADLDLEGEKTKRALIISPEATDRFVNAGATVQRMIQAGYNVSLVCVGDCDKSSISPAQFQPTALSARISTVVNLGFREGELSALPELILRHRLTEAFRALTPDTILLPDPWQPYTTHEAIVVGGVGSGAIHDWALQGAVGRIFYWEENGRKGTTEFADDAAQKHSPLLQRHVPLVSSSLKEKFHMSRFGR